MALRENSKSRVINNGRGSCVRIAQLLFLILAVVWMPFGVASCGDDAPPIANPNPNPGPNPIVVTTAPASATIGPEGGSIPHASGAVINVPAGALATPTQLTIVGIDPPTAATLGGATPLGQGFELGPEGQRFLKPVEVVLPFDPTRVPAGMNVATAQAHMAPRGSTQFTSLESVVDLGSRTIRTTTVHFTQFVPAINPSPISIPTPSPLPNAIAGQKYEQQLQASGGVPPYTWWLSSDSVLPPNLPLNSSGLLAGTPTVPTIFSFFIVARDSHGHQVQKAFLLSIGLAQNPAPVLTSIAPSSIPAGSLTTTIALTGSSFVPSSVATWDGAPLATTFVSGVGLSAAVPAASLATAGMHQLAVSTPVPGGGTSANVPFEVTVAVANPVPVVTSVNPTTVPISTTDTHVTVIGSAFTAATSAAIGTQQIPTTFVSATELDATIPAAFLATTATLQIGAYTPPPGGGFSATTAALSVSSANPPNNPVPTLTSITPPSIPVGSGTTTIALTGTGFVATSVAQWDGAALTTTFVSATVLSASVPAASITLGDHQVSVSTPAPGGGTSGNVVCPVVVPPNPVPNVVSVDPSSIVVSASATHVTIFGSQFTSSTSATVGMNVITTTFVSATELDATIPASYLAAPTTLFMGAYTPAPGGGHSPSSVSLAVTAAPPPPNPVPTLTSISPPSIPEGSGTTTITLTGTSFISASYATWDGTPLTTTFVSATGLTASVPAASITLGTHQVAVSTPAPGGGTSGNVPYQVTAQPSQPAPIVTSVNPPGVPTSGTDTQVTLVGSEFTPTTSATIGTTPIPTTFVSTTMLNATIPSSYLGTPTTLQLGAFKPPPGGGFSASTVPLTVTGGSNPVPTLVSISPTHAVAGTAGFTLTLTGSNFAPGAQAFFDSTALSTTVTSATTATATVPASAFVTDGLAAVIIVNPIPGGGGSGTVTFLKNIAPAFQSGDRFTQMYRCVNGGTGGKEIHSLTTDSAGNVYILAEVEGDCDFGRDHLLATDDRDIVLAKIDSGGHTLWSRRFGGDHYQLLANQNIAVDASGDVIIAFDNHGTVDLGLGPITNTGSNVILAKVSSAGVTLWQKQLGPKWSTAVRVSAQGQILLTGYGGGSSGYLEVFDATGNQVAIRNFSGGGIHITDFVIDSAGAATLVGYGGGPVAVNFGNGVVAGGSGSQCYVAHFDSTWNAVWANAYTNCFPQSIDLDASGNLFIAGSMDQPSNFGGTVSTPSGILFAKLQSNGTSSFVKSLYAAGVSPPVRLALNRSTGDVSLFGRNGGGNPGQADCFAQRYTNAGVLTNSTTCGAGRIASLAGALSPSGTLIMGGGFYGNLTLNGATITTGTPQQPPLQPFLASFTLPCDGGSTQVCGTCGTQSRACGASGWSAWSACVEGACAPPPPASLIAWYRFEETAGTTTVNSGSAGAALDGVVGPDLTMGVVGRVGNAFHYNGTSTSAVTVSDPGSSPLDLVAPFTIELWFRADVVMRTTDFAVTILQKLTGYADPQGFAVDMPRWGDGAFRTVTCAGGGCGTWFGPFNTQGGIVPATPNLWYHVALSRSATGDQSHYLNGSHHSTVTTVPMGTNDAPLTIGGTTNPVTCSLGGPGCPLSFNGIVDDVKIWNVARTASEVCTDATGTVTPTGCVF